MSFGAVFGGLASSGPTSQIASAYHQQKANKENREFSREMWDREYNAANTAYQRQVNDLRLAGLNPILSANLGGAATPHGSITQAAPIWTSENIKGLANTGTEVSKIKQAQKTVDANAKLAEEQVETQQTQQDVNKATATKAKADTVLSMELAGKAKSDKKLSDVNAIKNENEAGLVRRNEAIAALEEMKRINDYEQQKQSSKLKEREHKYGQNDLIFNFDQLMKRLYPLVPFGAGKK